MSLFLYLCLHVLVSLSLSACLGASHSLHNNNIHDIVTEHSFLHPLRGNQKLSRSHRDIWERWKVEKICEVYLHFAKAKLGGRQSARFYLFVYVLMGKNVSRTLLSQRKGFLLCCARSLAKETSPFAHSKDMILLQWRLVKLINSARRKDPGSPQNQIFHLHKDVICVLSVAYETLILYNNAYKLKVTNLFYQFNIGFIFFLI